MGYEYQSAKLRSADNTTTNLRPTQNITLLPANYPFAVGERIFFGFEIFANGAAFISGQRFWFNIALFNAAQRTSLPPIGAGWRIDILDVGGTLTATAQLFAGGLETSQQNYVLNDLAFSSGNTILNFAFFAYITNDLNGWISNTFNNNESRFLRSQNTAQLTDNSAQSVYRGTRFLEICMYESDLNDQPASLIFGDPYVRDPLATGFKTLSQSVRGKWYDSGTLGAQSWGVTDLNENALDTLTVTNAGLLFADIKRQPNPFLNTVIDANFQINTPRSLVWNAVNSVNVNFMRTSSAAYSNVFARLIRTDKFLFDNTQDFLTQYEADGEIIPLADATPAPNWINGTRFGTPASRTIIGNQLNLQFTLDGTRLVYGARYRFIFLLYNSATNFVSTHLSPELFADGIAPVNLTNVIGDIFTYNAQYTNVNDLQISQLERYKLQLTIDKTSYTGANFDAELARIELVETYQFGGIQRTNTYDFTPNASNQNSRIAVESNTGTQLVVSLSNRGYFNASASLQSSQQLWRIVFNQPLPSGGTQEVAIEFAQFIRIKKGDVTRITTLQLLDYQDFLASIDTVITGLCANDPFTVVDVRKSGAPDANLIALFIASDPNSPVEPSIFEAESYPSAYLPTLSTPILDAVESTFGDNRATYLIDNGQIATQTLTYSYAAIIYDI